MQQNYNKKRKLNKLKASLLLLMMVLFAGGVQAQEIVKMKNEISDRFPDAFIIAFKDGKKVNASEAINEWKNKKK